MHFHWGDLNTHSDPVLSRKISGPLVVTGADRHHCYSEGLAGSATLSAGLMPGFNCQHSYFSVETTENHGALWWSWQDQGHETTGIVEGGSWTLFRVSVVIKWKHCWGRNKHYSLFPCPSSPRLYRRLKWAATTKIKVK